ncbi:MAG: hypothetical protein K6U89_11730 [Chloroflexi bacterium]|jgi:hypothetical protein|nr:hypothetical protein [Chloroflexota bacterium]GIW12491.1 MAG: hypothetical protein KatS3mg061_3548 [Dehalococcoidia bacterium]
MHSSLIGKIEKARRYAQERHRVRFEALAVTFHGENADHTVRLEQGRWHCSCLFFQGWNCCSHTMALERILSGMLPPSAQAQGSELGSATASGLA